MEGFPSTGPPSTRHSRARGNPGLFSAELTWIPAFAGMTEPSGSRAWMEQSLVRVLHSTNHPRKGIFEGGHDPSPVGFGPQGEEHEVLVGAGFKPALTLTLRVLRAFVVKTIFSYSTCSP